MTRVGRYGLVLLLLVGLVWAGKGNGKPGGGGGGGGDGGGGSLPGAFYVFLETPTTNPYGIYGTADPVGSFVLDPDGTVAQSLDDLGEVIPGEPSHEMHGNLRAFLEIRDVTGYGALPDGSQRQVLVARLEDGSVHELTTAGDDIRFLGRGWWPSARWGKDDSFASFAAIVWDSSGTASTHIFEGPIVWAANGAPSFSATPAPAVDGTVTTQSGKVVSSLDGHDWSPDGSQLVYEDGTAIKVATFGATTTYLTVFGDNTAGDSDKGDPRWSPAAGSARIAFVNDDRAILLVDSDGTGLTTFAGGGQTRNSGPAWSPDGNHLAFVRYKDIKIKGQLNYTSDVYAGAADGSSSPVNLTQDVSDRVRCHGWR